MKNDLEEIAAASVPRPDVLCKRFVGWIEPVYGVVLYGVLYFLTIPPAVLLACIIGAVELTDLLKLRPHSFANSLTVILGLAVGIAGYALACWPFVGWAKRKRGRARALLRDGVLVEGRVATTTLDRFVQMAARIGGSAAGVQGANVVSYRVVFEHAGERHSVMWPSAKKPAEGSRRTVLFLPGYGYALVFDDQGRGVVSGVRGA